MTRCVRYGDLREPPEDPVGGHTGLVAEFSGISGRSGRGIETPVGLYEFWTDTEVPVRLHDATFLGLDYRLSPEPMLTMLFVYDDPEWTPAEAAATPIIRFSFTGVTGVHVDEDPEAWSEPIVPPGEVAAFDYFEPDGFDLHVAAHRVWFSARRLQVTLEPS